jgi:hypothetical protein
MSHEELFLAPNFVFLHTIEKKSVFHEMTGAFFVNFFNILKYV